MKLYLEPAEAYLRKIIDKVKSFEKKFGNKPHHISIEQLQQEYEKACNLNKEREEKLRRLQARNITLKDATDCCRSCLNVTLILGVAAVAWFVMYGMTPNNKV
jgi:hypothetical protein